MQDPQEKKDDVGIKPQDVLLLAAVIGLFWLFTVATMEKDKEVGNAFVNGLPAAEMRSKTP